MILLLYKKIVGVRRSGHESLQARSRFAPDGGSLRKCPQENADNVVRRRTEGGINSLGFFAIGEDEEMYYVSPR